MYALYINLDNLVKKQADKKIHPIRKMTTSYREYWNEDRLGEQQPLQAGMTPERIHLCSSIKIAWMHNKIYVLAYFLY